MTWTLVFAGGTCFASLVGYQCNLMVAPDGKYSILDFMRFGGVMQFVHFIATIAIVASITPQLVDD